MKIKSKEDIKVMTEGGKKLFRVKEKLKDEISVGASAYDIDRLADKLIKKEGAKASFKMVPKYSWATCVNVNEGVVHGIPKKSVVFEKGDVVSVDVGVYYKGFHTDTSFTVGLEADGKIEGFLNAGKAALRAAIEAVRAGNRIYDISGSIQEILEENGYEPIRALVGHGIGKNLHEEPQIPCFVSGVREESPRIKAGSTFAIEVMYTAGSPEIELDDDGWTISVRDGKISALFEETVAVTKKGQKVLTEYNLR
ncbi:MAG: type I methionyl aminopeptidase [Candidatus Woesebacteria bacterium]|jgi:methionyl aminopeptidase